MRVRGPISGFPAGYKSAAQKQLGKFESLGRDLGFRCVKRRLPDGTRIKTITMKNFATGREMTISGSNSAFQPFRVVRVRPPEEEDAFPAVEEELELKMDSGWLAFSAAWLAANLDHFPLGVYVGDEILTYFGQGTTVPGGTPSIQYLIPTAEWSDPAFLPPRLDWPAAAPPTVVAAGSRTYDSPIITDLSKLPSWQMFDPGHGGPVNLTAGRYTGLLRLAVQAKIGAGRDPRPLLWELTVANTFSASSGLVHDNEYNFWKIAIESNAALARRLTHQFEVDWIVVQFRLGLLGQYGDGTYTKYMAWLLMSLKDDTAGQTVSVLDSEDLLDVYDGRVPLKHGWHYNRTEPFEGSVVTTKEVGLPGPAWWIECTVAQINIGFEVAGGEPSFQLILETEDEKAGPKPLQPLWIEDRYGNGGVDPVVPPNGKSVAEEGDGTIVYVFYDNENVRQELKWTAQYEDDRSLIRELCYACGLIGTGHNNRWGAGIFTVGGWSIGEFSYGDPEFGAAVSQAVGNILISQEGQKTGEFVNDYRFDCSSPVPAQRRCGPLPTDPDVHPEETCIGPAQSWPYPDVPEGVQECGGDVLFEYGNAVYQHFDEYEEVISFRNFAIIPAGDAEAVLIGKAKRRNYWKRNREWALECCPDHPLAFTPLTHYWDGENIGPLSTWHNPLFPGCPDIGGVCGGSGPSNPDVDECIVGSRYPNGNCAPVQHDETIVHTVRSSGDAIDANQSYASDVNTFYTDWLPAYAADLTNPHEGWSVPTHGSFSGDGIVYAEIPTSGLVDGRKIEGGFPAFDNEDLHADTFFWTGWT